MTATQRFGSTCARNCKIAPQQERKHCRHNQADGGTDGQKSQALGLGIDEATALVVDASGVGTVMGSGAVYALAVSSAPELCRAGEPLTYSNIRRTILRAGSTITLPAGTTTSAPLPLSAASGALTPANPY